MRHNAPELTRNPDHFFRVTFSEPVANVDTGDFDALGASDEWWRVWGVSSQGGESGSSEFLKPCRPDTDRIYGHLGFHALDLVHRLEDECRRRQGMSRQYVVEVGSREAREGRVRTVRLALAGGQDVEDVWRNRLDGALPSGPDYQTFTVDRERPRPVLSADVAAHDGPGAFNNFYITIDFGEPVNGTFSHRFITLEGARANGGWAFRHGDGDRRYRLSIVPTGTGAITVRVGERAGVVDLAGNPNLAAEPLVIPYRPGALNLAAPADRTFTAGAPVDVALPRALNPPTDPTYALAGAGGAALPSWLSFDAGTRRMSGTPRAAAPAVTLEYTVRAGNASRTVTFTVTVDGALSVPAPADRTFTAGEPIAPVTLPAATGGGAPLTYALEGLPGGLEFDPERRRLSGTPSAATAGPATVTYRVTDANGAIATATFSITVEPAPLPGVTVSATSLVVPEGGSRTYTMVLDAEPDADVRVVPSVSGGGGARVVPESAVFSASSWDVAQTFTVSAGHDGDTDDESRTIGHTATSADRDYAGVAVASVAVTVEDDDTVGITVSPTELAIPEGEARTYEVRLGSRPSAEVLVHVAVSGSGADFRCCGRSRVTFTPGSWERPREFTVTALEDEDAADGTLRVRHWAESADPDYHGTPVATVTATAVDNDVGAPLTLGTPQSRTFTAGRSIGTPQLPPAGGGTVSYTYSLTGEGGAARPSWLSFDPATRRMSGTPQAAASAVTLDYTVNDGETSVTVSFTVTVNAAPRLTAPADQTYTAGTAIAAFTLNAATGGTAPLRYALEGLPGGLSFSTSSRRLSGTPRAATATPATVTYRVTDANGAFATDTFTVTVEPSTVVDATLSALGLAAAGTAVTLTPAFAPGTLAYTATVENDVATVTVSATATDTSATVAFTPATDADTSTAGHQVSLDEGENTITATVTNGAETETYTVTVTRQPSTVLWTAMLGVGSSGGGILGYWPGVATGGTLTPDNFTEPGGASITVTRLWWDSNGDIDFRIDNLSAWTGWTLYIGDDSASIDDAAGGRGQYTWVGFLSGTVPTTGTVAVCITTGDTDCSGAPVAEPDTTLNALGLAAGGTAVTLTPAFAPGTTSYTARVANDVETVTVSATATAASATVAFDPATDADTTTAGHQVSLDVGANTITATVTDRGASQDYTVTVTREAEPGVTVSPTALSVPEGQTRLFRVVLDSRPSADVTIAVARRAGGDLSLATNIGGGSGHSQTLTFTPGNWDRTQNVPVVFTADTDRTEGTATFDLTATSTDSSYNGISIASVTVTEVEPGVEVSTTSLSVPEDGSATFTVVLKLAPLANVTVSVAKQSGGDSDLTASPTSITFTPGTWNQPRTVTISAAEDSDSAHGTAVFELTTTSAATNFNNLPVVSVTATEADNDVGSGTVTVSTTALSVPEGQSRTFTVVLDSQPSADVTIAVAKRAGGDADLNTTIGGSSTGPQTLTFTSANWDQTQSVPVVFTTDADRTQGTATFDLTATSTDSDYNGISIASVTATELEPGVVVSKTSLSVPEDGSATFTVALNSRPLSNVTVSVTKQAGGDVDLTASPASLTFTNTNWHQAQTVTVSAAEDSDSAHGSAVFDLTTTSTSAHFNNLTVDSVTATEVDNDSCETDDIWCTEMTVGTTGTSIGFCGGFPICSSPNGSVADDDFELDATTYEVHSLRWIAAGVGGSGGNLSFALDSVPAATVYRQWTLYIGDDHVSFSGASASARTQSGISYSVFTFTGFYATGSGRTPPASGTTVTVRLTATPPPDPLDWSATLSVDNGSSHLGYCSGSCNADLGESVGFDGGFGGLTDGTDNAFTIPGTSDTVAVTALAWATATGSVGNNGDVLLRLSPLPEQSVYGAWSLTIGSADAVPLSGAVRTRPDGTTTLNAGVLRLPDFFGTASPPADGASVTVSLASDGASGGSGPAGTAGPGDGLEARFLWSPDWHTGMGFWTELRFSAPPKLGWRDVRDRVLEVTGARIARARRLVQGSNLSWRLLVEPDGFGDVTLTLPPTADCAAEGAVCTADGERLVQGVALAVPGPGDRLAARLTGHDTPHTGEPFELELHFSEAPRLGYRTVRDQVFDVTGGTIRRAQRLVRGSNLGWRLTVEPDGVGAVTLDLPATEDCAAEGAVCTRDGKRLERGVAVTVEGPAAFSVSDAEVDEEPGAALAFEVTLSRRLGTEAQVEVSTRDGTATAGADYEAVTRTLVFAPGETSKTVEVPVLDDAHDEGRETMTLVLSNAVGAPIDDAEGTGTIVNSDAIPKAWIARFGRTVTGQVLDAVEARLAAPREAGMRATLAGQALPVWSGRSEEGGAQTPQAGTADRAAMERLGRVLARADGGADRPGDAFGAERGPDVRTRGVTGQELLLGTSFTLTAGSAEGAGHSSLWGDVSVAGFDGREDALTLDGRVTTGLLGADFAAERWTAGLALGHSVGTGGYRRGDCDATTRPGGCGGRVEADLTGLYPYAGMDLTERVSVWLAGGHGAGELTVTPDGQGAIETDLAMSMGAAGTRIAVLEPEGGEGLRLALKGDGRFTRTSSDAARAPEGGNLAEAEADVWLLRFGLEGSRRFALGGSGAGDAAGASLTPSFELAVRRDGGDAETGLGADMGGGVAFADPKHGLRFDLKGRALVVHEASGFREWGARAAFRFDPRPSTERGLSLSLTQSWGASPAGGMDSLLNRETLAGLAANDDDGGSGFEASSRLEGELGYGLPAFGGGFTGTPNLGFGLSETARDVRVGWRLTRAAPGAVGFEVNLDATRREAANDDAAHAVTLRGRLRW